MQEVQKIKSGPLTPEVVMRLHRIVTDETLDDPSAAGRLRTPAERVEVVDESDGEVLHTPPPADSLPERLDALCRFANGEEPDYFIHPVVRAMALHFMLAYDHPFVDGNGRTARALFYWSALREGYWIMEYLSISEIIRKAPAQYARAYLYTETDDSDLTYFLLYHLDVIRASVRQLADQTVRRADDLRKAESLIRHLDLNHRQVELLSHALRNPDEEYTIAYHQNSQNVVYQTARTDLIDLENRGLLIKRKRGKKYCYFSPPDLLERLESTR
jgi:Fic family protein